ncbi:MAG: uL22 family ribosomal protein [Nanoarchaeota archaeon]
MVNKLQGMKEENLARAIGKNLRISTKHSIAICRFIKNKTLDRAISDLEIVAVKKKAIPMRGEIPHRRNMSLASGRGRFPVKASRVFIKLLKALRANASVKNLDAEACVIKTAKADKAAKPPRAGRLGRTGKRTNVLLITEESEKFKTAKIAGRTEKKKVKESKKKAESEEKEREKELIKVTEKESLEAQEGEIDHKDQAGIFRRKERHIEGEEGGRGQKEK